MKALNGPNGIKDYRVYTFTDIFPGFLSSARESMADLRDISFSIFDTEVDPLEQEYGQAYDLVLACQVFHATSDIYRTLLNYRKLLKPGGRLVLVETTRNFTAPGAVAGTLIGYWAGIPDGRMDESFQRLDFWDSSLRKAGFSELDVVLDDFLEPHNTTSVVLSTVLPEVTKPSESTVVDMLHGTRTASTVVKYSSLELIQRGVAAKVVHYRKVFDAVTTRSHVVSLLDEKNLMAHASERDLNIFQALARNTTSLVVGTSCSTTKIPDLLHVLQNENPASQYVPIDVNAENLELENKDARDLARCIVDQILHQEIPMENGQGNPTDRDFSSQVGCMWDGRYIPDAGFNSQYSINSHTAKTKVLPRGSQGAVRAAPETSGLLKSWRFYNHCLRVL